MNILGMNELKELNFWTAVIAELVASAVYIVIVCGCGLSEQTPSNLHISLTVAFTVAVLASAFWDVSGGHFNPVVTLAMLLLKKVSVIRFIMYVIAQCVGSIGGAALLLLFTPKAFLGTLGVLQLHNDIDPGVGFLIEVVLTFQFIWTVVSSTDPIKNFSGFQAPFAIGLSVGIALLMGIPYTGAALNPIRALGPAVVMKKFDDHWIYWVGPIMGSLLATLTYQYIPKLTSTNERNSSIELAEVMQNQYSTVEGRKEKV